MADPLALLQPKNLAHLSEALTDLMRRHLWAQILFALLLAVGAGVALGPDTGWVEPATAAVVGEWVALPGKLFLALVQLVAVPLVFASVARGLAAGEDKEQLKRLGTRAVLYFLSTTVVAITIGLGLASLIKPGALVDTSALTSPSVTTQTPAMPGLADLPSHLIALLPANPVASLAESQMLQVVILAALMGVALISMQPQRARPLLDLLGSLLEVCMVVVKWAMYLAPLAVFGLVTQLVATTGLSAFVAVGAYMGTVLVGLALLVTFYLVLVMVFAQRSPLTFLRHIREVQLLAFSTSSSAAVMPLSMKTAQDQLEVRPSISQLVVPLGATINMDGTALYQGVATVFLAQAFGVDLGLSALALVVVTAVSASVGAPGTPGVGIVLLAMILEGVGIPSTGIALILGVDRLLDMARTAANVTGDLAACVLMDRWVGGPRTAEEEAEHDADLDERRESTGEDVVIAPTPPSTSSGEGDALDPKDNDPKDNDPKDDDRNAA